jgi:hypothetical protein
MCQFCDSCKKCQVEYWRENSLTFKASWFRSPCIHLALDCTDIEILEIFSSSMVKLHLSNNS